MSAYRRYRVAGGTYFFTVCLADRGSDLLVVGIDDLREAARFVMGRAPFHVDAWVVLPDHMHCVWTLPPGDEDFSGRWRALKGRFSRMVEAGEWRSASRVVRGERGIWQRRFWEHAIRDERDYAAHVDYVHFNPVKHGYVAHPADWAPSSFRRCVAKGMYPPDWAPGEVALAEAGERAG